MEHCSIACGSVGSSAGRRRSELVWRNASPGSILSRPTGTTSRLTEPPCVSMRTLFHVDRPHAYAWRLDWVARLAGSVVPAIIGHDEQPGDRIIPGGPRNDP